MDPWGPWRPAFIGGSEVADGTDTSLSVLALPSAQRTTVYQGCPDSLVTFGWSPSGDYLTYVREVGFPAAGAPWQFEWHLAGHGGDRLLATTAAWCHCDGEGPADNYSLAAGFSPDGNYVFLVENGVGLGAGATVGIQVRDLNGDLIAAETGGGMPAWSGGDLYFRNASGVLKWHAGTTKQVLSATQWIRPSSSPAGGQIVYWVRAADGLGRVYLLNLTSGTTRQLSTEPRMEPVFLSSRYIWYEGERACTDADKCVFQHTMPTGFTYIYDLSNGTESQSVIAAVYDVWPHGT
jgi:hypothetical protein